MLRIARRASSLEVIPSVRARDSITDLASGVSSTVIRCERIAAFLVMIMAIIMTMPIAARTPRTSSTRAASTDFCKPSPALQY